MYEIYLENAAVRDLKKLPRTVYNKVIQSLKSLVLDARPKGVRKIVTSKRDWRIRLGDYRILYEIDDKAKIIRVMRIIQRKDAYKR